MKPSSGLTRLWIRIRQVSLFTRIALGNALVISLGAVAGTLLTRHFSHILDGWLIAAFATFGICLSLLVNSLILNAALHPIRELRKQAESALKPGSSDLQLSHLKNPDPDTVSLADSLRSLVNQLEDRNQELSAISERVINAQEEERKSIARSLHDDTGQALTMLIISLDRLEARLPADQTEIKKDIQLIRDLASSALTELRRIVFGLRPAILDDLGLVPAIRWYARSCLEPAGIHFDLSAPDSLPELPTQINISLFRIAQEAINNILRHASASLVQVSISIQSGNIQLEVKDNGCGFKLQEETEAAVHSHHLGLLGLRERAELLGGEVHLVTDLGQGTSLQVHLPLSSTIRGDEEDPHPAG